MKRQLLSQILEQQFFSLAARRAPLSESIQLGAQVMLQKAVELEVTEFLGGEHYCPSGDEPLRGYRNGYEDKQVQTAEGPLHLRMPQVRGCVRRLARCEDYICRSATAGRTAGRSSRDSSLGSVVAEQTGLFQFASAVCARSELACS